MIIRITPASEDYNPTSGERTPTEQFPLQPYPSDSTAPAPSNNKMDPFILSKVIDEKFDKNSIQHHLSICFLPNFNLGVTYPDSKVHTHSRRVILDVKEILNNHLPSKLYPHIFKPIDDPTAVDKMTCIEILKDCKGDQSDSYIANRSTLLGEIISSLLTKVIADEAHGRECLKLPSKPANRLDLTLSSYYDRCKGVGKNPRSRTKKNDKSSSATCTVFSSSASSSGSGCGSSTGSSGSASSSSSSSGSGNGISSSATRTVSSDIASSSSSSGSGSGSSTGSSGDASSSSSSSGSGNGISSSATRTVSSNIASSSSSSGSGSSTGSSGDASTSASSTGSGSSNSSSSSSGIGISTASIVSSTTTNSRLGGLEALWSRRKFSEVSSTVIDSTSNGYVPPEEDADNVQICKRTRRTID
jgi:hypothetical protein